MGPDQALRAGLTEVHAGRTSTAMPGRSMSAAVASSRALAELTATGAATSGAFVSPGRAAGSK